MSAERGAAAEPEEPLLRVDDIVKTFPGLTALNGVSLTVAPREIVALVGHNGSGKSTLVKVLAGVYEQDSGTVELAAAGGPDEAATRIHFIHQDLALIGELTAVENMNVANVWGLGALRNHDDRAQRARARDLISRFGEEFDLDVPVKRLTPAQRAIVAIARALDGWSHDANVLVLDEPTESLSRSEVDVLFAAVKRLAGSGAGVVFISHRLDEVLELADRVVVLRNGNLVADEAAATIDHDRLVELITGTSAHQISDSKAPVTGAPPVISVRGMEGGGVRGLDLDVAAGEIVGVAGVLGAGREDVPALLFGARPSTARSYTVMGHDHLAPSPGRSIRRGLAYVPADRAGLGSIADFAARENITLPHLRSVATRTGLIRSSTETAEAERLVREFDVKPPRPEQKFKAFSGGNQQKIVMAKWLRADPKVLLLEEPTQGVDIGAKAAIYESIEAAASRGTAVVVSSSDEKELLRLCHRVIVLRQGRQVADLSGDQLTEHRLILESHGLTNPKGAA